MNIKVSIIEDHKEYRESIAMVLSNTKGIEILQKFKSVENAMQDFQQPDVLLQDINLPGISGIEAVIKFKEKFPKIKILMLTVFEDEENIFNSILAGADGYLLKKSTPQRLIQAIKEAYEGGAPMTPSIAKKTLKLFKEKFSPSKKEIDISEREKEVLQFIIEGNSNQIIAGKLFISVETVRNHVKHIYQKMHVHSRSQAIVKALKEKMI